MILITKVLLFLLACIISTPIPSPKIRGVGPYAKAMDTKKVKGAVASVGRVELNNGGRIIGPTAVALKHKKENTYDLSANLVAYKGNKVRAELGPSLKTGFSKSDGQVSASLLGVGFNYGKMTGIETPVGSFYVIRGRYQDDDEDDESFDDSEDFEDDESFEDGIADDESFEDDEEDLQ
jgi:hypothetical protein